MNERAGENEYTPDECAVSSDMGGSRWINLSSSPVCGTLSGLVLAYAEEETYNQDHKECHADDLECETRNHDMDTFGGLLFGG